MLPHSEACERNKKVILDVLKKQLVDHKKVLEIGTGTAQHAVYFARHLPHLIWQPSDQAPYLSDIQTRIELEAGENVISPVLLDVSQQQWSLENIDAVFSANTLHIMSWHNVQHFFRGVGQVLQPKGKLIVYGPFKYSGQYTSDSNGEFDLWLKQRDPQSGIRDFEQIDQLAEQQGLNMIEDIAMPANNQCLIWQRAL